VRGFETPELIDTNGIRMAVYGGGNGPPLVLCHGFPELAYSWRHQLAPLRDAGYQVLIPDQRGYGATDKPAAVEAYDIDHLTGDLVGLLDHYGHEKAVFVGHDWARSSSGTWRYCIPPGSPG
jgi:non-specific protein-tyrosine kinase